MPLAQKHIAPAAIAAAIDNGFDWKGHNSALDTELALRVDKIRMTPADAIRSATLIEARAAGMENGIGTIGYRQARPQGSATKESVGQSIGKCAT